MKVVMQRVERASVRLVATGEIVGQIQKGVVCFLGVGKHDHK